MFARTARAIAATAVAVATATATGAGAVAATASEAPAAPADVRVTAAATSGVIYNDPRRTQQWAVSRLAGEKVRATRTARGTIVAVIDSGVQGNHPDLMGRIVTGYDFVAGKPGGTVDGYGHGTHIAGIIAANVNNRTGVSGYAPDARIMPLRVLDSSGVGAGSNVARALRYAADHGAKVANVSLASAYYAPIADAVKYAQSKGVIVVAAVGNSRLKGNAVNYPAALPGVIGVAAEDSTGRPSTFSNTGSYVDITAPGVSVISTYKGSTYASMTGTSMAAPYASAAIAVLNGAKPGITASQALYALQRTARDMGTAGRDDVTGAGEIRPLNALCSLVSCS